MRQQKGSKKENPPWHWPETETKKAAFIKSRHQVPLLAEFFNSLGDTRKFRRLSINVRNEGCPSSKHLGHLSLLSKGESGLSWFDVKLLGVDGSSGVSG